MNQIAGQLSLNDFFAQAVPIGMVSEVKIGKFIPFGELKNYKDRKVVYQSTYGGDESKSYSKVVLITNYFENSDTYYKNELNGQIINDFVASLSGEETKKHLVPAFVCDRIAYSDDDRTKKANCCISEAYCSNGRHQIVHNSSSVCFYELNVM